MSATIIIFRGLLLFAGAVPFLAFSQSKDTMVSNQPKPTEWNLETLNAENASVVKEGKPQTVEVDGRKGVRFDGVRDGLFLESNPLTGLTQFTVEVIFRPDPKAPHEQRFLHFGEAQGDRMLLETRVTEDDNWYLDAFIKSGGSSTTLIDTNRQHPTGRWYHAALVVDNGRMNTFVNGAHELTGTVNLTPMTKGTASIGVRMNRVSWFKGVITRVRITPRCLQPSEFMKP